MLVYLFRTKTINYEFKYYFYNIEYKETIIAESIGGTRYQVCRFDEDLHRRTCSFEYNIRFLTMNSINGTTIRPCITDVITGDFMNKYIKKTLDDISLKLLESL